MSWKFFVKSLPFEMWDDFWHYFNEKHNRRPSSAPLLSGDTYRALSDFLYDQTALCTTEDINSFSISKIDKKRKTPLVFVSSWKLEDFSSKVLPNINKPFVLITHQGDVNIKTPLHKKILKNKFIIHWFAQNNELDDPKITCLPIGLEDAWKHCAGTPSDFLSKKLIRNTKNPHILYGFSINTNPESRAPCYISLCRCKVGKEIYGKLTPHLYRKLLSSSMFVASPVGNGLDCHRTWEALYLGVVPIIEDNFMNRSFKNLNLPVILINPSEWSKLKKWTPETMTALFNKTIKSGNTEAAYLPYWINQFNQYLY